MQEVVAEHAQGLDVARIVVLWLPVYMMGMQ
jgi:hypothetical protein